MNLISVATTVSMMFLAAASPLDAIETRTLCGGFLPPNDLSIPVGSLEDKGITKEQFDAVMDQAEALYAPVIAARGGALKLNRLWENPTVNASAQRLGDTYILNMYGGLARHETITQDGMALVVCHELGHHLGGAPKYRSMGWASNEGQSDYFANLKCLHRIFGGAGARNFTRLAGDETTARESCARSYVKPADVELCARASMAGTSVTTLFRVLRRETKIPRFDTPDPAVVLQTQDSHPGTQCRLDTYFSGSLCPRPAEDPLDERNPAVGTCTRASGFTVGLRPLCWYKPAADENPALTIRPLPPETKALSDKLDALRGVLEGRGI